MSRRDEEDTLNRVEGKLALITGGARGVGASLARRFVAEGAEFVLDGGLADQFYRAAEGQQDTRITSITVTDDELMITGSFPLGSTMIVCAPTCDTAVVAKHVAACLAAGNTIELAGKPTVIVLTDTDAFLNEVPRVRFPDPAGNSTPIELKDFYTRSSTVRVPAGRDSR